MEIMRVGNVSMWKDGFPQNNEDWSYVSDLFQKPVNEELNRILLDSMYEHIDAHTEAQRAFAKSVIGDIVNEGKRGDS